MGKEKLAVDIVIIPPPDIVELAIKANQRLLENVGGGDKICLSKETRLPHVSLCMGVLAEKKMSEAKTLLDRLAEAFLPLDLTIPAISVRHSFSGEPICSFEIEPQIQLQNLHQDVMRGFERILDNRVDGETVFSDAVISASTVQWVERYKTDSSFQNFWPHITLGIGTLKPGFCELPQPLVVKRLGLFQLGNHCTCKRLLAQTAIPLPKD